MSHFSVAVFSSEPKDVARLLEPYNENVGCLSPFSVFEESDDFGIDPVKQKRGHWYNPNAKWDWWEIGGRWSGFLNLKENRIGRYNHLPPKLKQKQLDHHVCDQAFITDCLLERNETKYRRALRHWEIAVEGAEMTDEEKEHCFILYRPEYYKQQFGSKERFADETSEFRTYAFITAEGAWHETATMGWFGCDNATRESRDAYNLAFDEYLKLAQRQSLLITIVDCHI